MPRSAIAYAVVLVMVLLAVTGCNEKQRPAVSGGDGATVAAASAEVSKPQEPGADKPAGIEAKADQSSLTGAAGALALAAKEDKHLILLAWSEDDETTKKAKANMKEAAETLSGKARFYELDVNNPDESEFVTEYRVSTAPMPLTLVFAPNGVVVDAHVQKAVSVDALGKSFVSPKLAEVFKLLQDQKLVLLCVQGDGTRHNSESMAAAREVVADEQAAGQIVAIRVDPGDEGVADLVNKLNVTDSETEAAIHILVPPGTVAGVVEGATTKQALWEAIGKAVAACSSGGCGAGGCG